MGRLLAACCCASVCFSVCSAAPADAAPRARQDPLQRAKKLLDRLRYKDALPVLQQAVEDPALDAAQHREALALLGTVQVILDDEAAARRSFARLLTEDAGYRLDPDLSPKILDVYEAVRLQLYPPLRASLDGPPRLIERADDTLVEVTVQRHGDGALEVQLWRRASETATAEAVRMRELQPGIYQAELGPRPAPAEAPQVLQYWLQVRGPDQAVLAALGDATTPLEGTVAPRAPPPLPEPGPEPVPTWVWIGAGGGLALVAAGIAVTTAVLLSLPPPDPASSLGTYTLE